MDFDAFLPVRFGLHSKTENINQDKTKRKLKELKKDLNSKSTL